MEITLTISDLLGDIREKSRLETAGMPVEDRYRIETGTEKYDEIFRDLLTVASSLSHLFYRYLVSYEVVKDSEQKPVSFKYDIEMADRRKAGKGISMQDKMQDYLVHYTLAKYYASVSSSELSNAHSAQTEAAAAELSSLIYTKKEPEL